MVSKMRQGPADSIKMNDEKEQNLEEEKRGYFRVNDVISVVVNPIDIEKENVEEHLKTAAGSKAFSLFDVSETTVVDAEHITADFYENTKLYNEITEIKAKLDFIINHLMLDKEGLLSADKKLVNISASGIRFTVKEPVNVKDIMEIKLLLPTLPPVAVFAYGEVKRVKALEDETYEIALEYLNMGDSVRDEIIQYTLSHQRERISKLREVGKDK
jgi:hypothetical protein